MQAHLLTDTTEAGLVLDEDMMYKMNIPVMEEAGIRYHAIVLPKSFFARWIRNQTSLSNRKLKVEYFDSVLSAFRWLRKRYATVHITALDPSPARPYNYLRSA